MEPLPISEMYRLAVEHATNHIIITDVDGVILFANSGVERNTGYAPVDVIGKTPKLWGGQMDKGYYEQFWRVIKDEKKPFIGQFQNKRKNGDLYWARATVSPILNQGNLVGFIGVEEDITEVREATLAKAATEARFEVFMNHSPMLAWMKDSQFHHVYINQAFSDFFHESLDDIKTKTDDDLYPPAVAKSLHAHDLSVIETGSSVTVEEAVPGPDGSEHIWLVYKFPFKDAAGLQMIGGMAIDITDRKQMETALRREIEETKKINDLTIGRKIKMRELKTEITTLKNKLESKV